MRLPTKKGRLLAENKKMILEPTIDSQSKYVDSRTKSDDSQTPRMSTNEFRADLTTSFEKCLPDLRSVDK